MSILSFYAYRQLCIMLAKNHSRLLDDVNRMNRPHETRKNTMLFPELRKIISGNE